MKNFSIVFLFLIHSAGFSQNKKPIIHSNTRDILIKHEKTIVEWHAEPTLNPDLYIIENNLCNHLVSVITNSDSIQFELKPGKDFEFNVVVNDTLVCNTKVIALSNPLFFYKTFYIPWAIVSFLLFCWFFVKRKDITPITLLQFGFITAIFFWVMLLAGGILHKNYSHIKMGVSELGTIGTDSEFFMAICSMLLAYGTLLFSIGFYRASKILQINKIPSLLSFVMPVSMAWGAIFPSGNVYHGLLGPLPLGIITGALIAFLLWPKNKSYATIKKLSLLSCVIMCLFITRFIPELQQNFEGLIQRSLWFGWAIWTTAVSFSLIKLLRNKINNN